MNISRLNESEFVKAYNIYCAEIPTHHLREGNYPTFCRIPVDSKTLPHSHFESEIFYIIRGDGQMQIGNELEAVTAGDLIGIPPFSKHELANCGHEELIFLSVYSEDFEVARIPETALITAAPPTPNGPLHLGHISGPYLASDIVSRYLRLRGAQVISHCGTDDHQNYVYEAALKRNLPPESYRTQMRSRILDGLSSLGIGFTTFTEPKRNASYQESILAFFNRAKHAGLLESKELSYPYCAECDHFLYDALIQGHCPNCANLSQGACETCGFVAPPFHLTNATCTRCKNPAISRTTTLTVFALHKFLHLLSPDLSTLKLSPKIRTLIRHVRALTEVPVAITSPGGPGVPVPNSNQVLHVWFEMAAHYEQFALSPAQWTHCFGFDNAFYYLLFIPALHRALNAEAKLPDAIVCNDFLSLDGAKFSTSRKHAIWADEFVGNTEHLRFFLALHRPASDTTDFSMVKFQEFSKEMQGNMEKLLMRALKNEDTRESISNPEAILHCNRFTRDMEYALSPETLDLRRASRRILEFMDRILHGGIRGLEEKIMLQTLATVMAPFMPDSSEALLLALGVKDAVWMRDWTRAL